MSTDNRPEILLLSLDYLDFLDDTHAALLDKLAKSARVRRVKTANAALRYLDDNNPNAIIITDQGLTDWRHHEVLRKVQTYIRYGGRAIIGVHFPGFVTADVFDNFFALGFGLPWERGDYTGHNFELNPSCILPEGVKSSSLPAPPYTKVLHIKGARPHEKILIPLTYPDTESLGSSQEIFEEESEDEIQAAVTGARIGSGYLAYCGNVNPEETIERIILSLCGLPV